MIDWRKKINSKLYLNAYKQTDECQWSMDLDSRSYENWAMQIFVYPNEWWPRTRWGEEELHKAEMRKNAAFDGTATRFQDGALYKHCVSAPGPADCLWNLPEASHPANRGDGDGLFHGLQHGEPHWHSPHSTQWHHGRQHPKMTLLLPALPHGNMYLHNQAVRSYTRVSPRARSSHSHSSICTLPLTHTQ